MKNKTEDRVVDVQRQDLQELSQLLKISFYFWRIVFLGICISLIQLVQNGLAAGIAGYAGMGTYVFFSLSERNQFLG